jgi:hypothetical protein
LAGGGAALGCIVTLAGIGIYSLVKQDVAVEGDAVWEALVKDVVPHA